MTLLKTWINFGENQLVEEKHILKLLEAPPGIQQCVSCTTPLNCIKQCYHVLYYQIEYSYNQDAELADFLHMGICGQYKTLSAYGKYKCK